MGRTVFGRSNRKQNQGSTPAVGGGLGQPKPSFRNGTKSRPSRDARLEMLALVPRPAGTTAAKLKQLAARHIE